ncbi:nitrogen permease regulator of amino acid transport activity 3-domain-containing protein [Fomitopsis serialis]|uniref:nitrogen permease regulator of amino acid transport activity 3-domain-containing protein n=1 Tax=Fomitopsis serialis TaxID=139415 RepID=UPI002008B871|nr:nitrogen permease regulator of amino acid transport activity 3-domain-containing protein [Neoantrodia serialis]KAH9928699.1 nitrogen permease regulator of amino acid transport activity 3-domain-containing protein [Neoantrodia serialis]
MCETLIAVLLVTSSAKGSSLVYRWPPSPESSVRLARPRLNHDVTCIYGDNPWRAANGSENPSENRVCPEILGYDEDAYIWQRPGASRHRSSSVSHSRSHPASRRASPAPDMSASFSSGNPGLPRDDEYDTVLGYSAEFLAGLLCPQVSMCHQKFEFIVDDLAFIGHPVCAEPDGLWRFKPDKAKSIPRGRVSKKGEAPQPKGNSLTPDSTEQNKQPLPDSSWLQTFHLVLVLDRPDPSSSTSGTVWKYFDTIYEHIAFTVTAVLYQEQVLHNFVEGECDTLGSLRDEYSKKGEPFAEYLREALNVSSIAVSMKTLYEAMKERSIARIVIHDLPLELQLPPYLDSLLHAHEECDFDTMESRSEDDLPNSWGSMSVGWRLPALKPWKSLLRLYDEDERGNDELYRRLRAPQPTAEDNELAEQLARFLEIANVTLSLADMASLLDWDLESQVYPTVRWLVHHRRAKVVDIVHPGLRTVFTVPPKFNTPMSELTADFDRRFAEHDVSPLPKILAMVSMSTHQQSANHFYGTVVGSKERIQLYHNVVVWMLKRDLLITLHLRIRIVATEELKHRVRMKYEMARAKRERIQARSAQAEKESNSHDSQKTVASKEAPSIETSSESSPGTNWLSFSPKTARALARRQSVSAQNQGSVQTHPDVAEKRGIDDLDEEVGSSGAEDVEDWYRGNGDDNNPYSSMITDPARASRLERRWLAAMSEGKDPYIATRFEKINQYFDGKCTDDEILFRAEISRKQLREVLHHYDEYLQTFLHPS